MAAPGGSKWVACASLALMAGVSVANGCSSSGNSCRVDCGSASGSTTSSTSGSTGASSSPTGTGSSTATSSSTASETGSLDAATSGSMCSLPAPDAGLTLFVATPNPLCPSTINLPQSGWFESDDGTSDAGTLIDATSTPGCAGANDCSYHFKGSGYTGWGALVGFNTSTTAADGGVVPDGVAASYTGFQFWLMGTSAGTRTSGYVAANNSVKVIFPTTTNRNEDDYAYYCPTEGDAGNGWVFCQIPFSSLKRDGFSSTPPVATDMFDVANLTKVEFQLAAYQAADGAVPTPVSFDLRLDDIAFY